MSFLLAVAVIAGLLAFAPPPPPPPPSAIVVIGAGPASLAFCHRYLQQRRRQSSSSPSSEDGDDLCCIHVYEKRPSFHPTSSSSSTASSFAAKKSRAFGFGLGPRPRRILGDELGLWDACRAVAEPVIRPSRPRPAAGAAAASNRTGDHDGSVIVDRDDLCRALLEELRKRYGERQIQVHMGCECVDVNAVERSVTIRDARSSNGEETIVVPYSLLVAGDGANSVVRKRLSDRFKGRRYLFPKVWKALALPPQPELPPGQFLKTGGMVTLPRHPGCYSLLFFYDGNATNPCQNPFGVDTVEEFRTAVTASNPNVTVFPSDGDLREFLRDAAGKTGFLLLRQHALPDAKIALLGDAASHMSSWLGQGCAFAVWTGAKLAEQLLTSNSTKQALRDWSVSSAREGRAITELNLMSRFLGVPGGSRVLHFPRLLSMLDDPDLPYHTILRAHRWRVRAAKFLSGFSHERIPL
jgi:2-polyprenyl-6-methoxyphenol hydroxylase-like FAD-dependent oxidoreductase